MEEDWAVLRSFLPPGWEELGRSSGALKGLRKDKSAESVLRVLLLHLGCGHSLRETALRARKAGLSQLSDVALLKRLRKSSDWLQGLCVALFCERGLAVAPGLRVRAVDATTVREPGRTGSLWRVHYSLCLSSLSCDFFEVTPARGAGGGEYLARFPVGEGDHILADRGYSTAAGQQGQARNACSCRLCHRLHHVRRRSVQRPRGSGMVSPALAGRAGLQTPQVPGAVGPPAQA